MIELNDAEKTILKDAVRMAEQARMQVSLVQAEAQRRAAHLEAVVNTVTRLKGLDPNKHTFAYDVAKDLYELRAIAEPTPPPAAEPPAEAAEVIKTVHNGDGPPQDISGLLALHELEKRLND